jgi:P-type conjugative transfer protein TrbL
MMYYYQKKPHWLLCSSALWLVIIIIMVIFADNAYAADAVPNLDENMLTKVMDKYAEVAKDWGSIIMDAATRLFWILASISLAYTLGIGYIKGEIGDIRGFFAYFIQFCLFFGFFLELLRNGPMLAKLIISSMEEIAVRAGVAAVNPGSIISSAAKLVGTVISEGSWITSPMLTLGAFAVSLMVLLMLVLVAGNLLVEYCAAWVLIYLGVFFLGFGATRWTSDIAQNYFRAVLGAGIRILSILFLVGVATSIVNDAISNSGSNADLASLLHVLITALLLVLLTNKIPPMLSGLVQGGGQYAGGGAGAAIAGMVGAGIGVAAGVGVASAMGGVSGTKNLVGAVQSAGSIGGALTNAATNLSDKASGLMSSFLGGGNNISAPTGGASSGSSGVSSLPPEAGSAVSAPPSPGGDAGGGSSSGQAMEQSGSPQTVNQQSGGGIQSQSVPKKTSGFMDYAARSLKSGINLANQIKRQM